VAVGVDGLAEEDHLGRPVRRDLGDLGDDLLGIAVLLIPPNVGYDTVRAPVVAPTLDRDPGADPGSPSDLQPLVVLVRLEVQDREASCPAGRVAPRLRRDGYRVARAGGEHGER